jgi:hypothetical protein
MYILWKTKYEVYLEMLKRLHMSKRDNRVNRDRLRRENAELKEYINDLEQVIERYQRMDDEFYEN